MNPLKAETLGDLLDICVEKSDMLKRVVARTCNLREIEQALLEFNQACEVFLVQAERIQSVKEGHRFPIWIHKGFAFVKTERSSKNSTGFYLARHPLLDVSTLPILPNPDIPSWWPF